MNPIEAMARALWDSASIEQTPWIRSFDEQPCDVKRRLCNDMRSALIALRDCEGLRDIAINAGHVPSCVDVKAFRAMINAILEEG